MEEVLIDSGDSTGYKRIVLRLRWVTIIVTSCIILLGRGISAPQILPSLLIFLYLFSNFIAYFLPSSYFSRLHFFYLILLFDTFMVSLGIYLTSQFNTDFYLVYFLIIIFASIARSIKLLMINAVQKRIFDPFFTTKGIQRSGLGLSISYGIIHRHHGEIKVESREGTGTAFRIELPTANEEKERRENDGERSSTILHHSCN